MTRLRDDDTESGKGLSLPQSPHSMSSVATVIRGTSSGPRSVDSDFEDSRHDYRNLPDVALSLCGNFADGQADPPEELFLQSMVTYDDFVENPRLIENPDLLVRIDHKYYTWQAACPIIMSWALYQRVLPQSTVDTIIQEYGRRESDKKKKSTEQAVTVAAPEAPRTSSWFPWRRSQKTSTTVPPETLEIKPATTPSAKQPADTVPPASSISETVADPPTTGTSSDNESNDSSTVTDGAKKLPLERRSYYENTDVFCKTLRLSSEQIVSRHVILTLRHRNLFNSSPTFIFIEHVELA